MAKKPLCDKNCCFYDEPAGGFKYKAGYEKVNGKQRKYGYHKNRKECKYVEWNRWRRRRGQKKIDEKWRARNHQSKGNSDDDDDKNGDNKSLGSSGIFGKTGLPGGKRGMNSLYDELMRNSAKVKAAAKEGQTWDSKFFKQCVIENHGDASIRDAMATLRFEAANKFLTGWKPAASDSAKLPKWGQYEGSTEASWKVAREELTKAHDGAMGL